MLARFVRAAGLALTVGAAAAIALVVTDRLLALESPSWLLIGAPVMGAIMVAATWAALTPRRPLDVAAEIDRALRLEDRLGSAMALQSRSNDDPFAALAVAEGERVAPEVRVRQATPIVFGGAWWAWPVVLAAAVAGAIFLPAFDLAQRRQQEAQLAKRTAERDLAAADLAEARNAVAPDETEMVDLATPTDLQTLEELERQLAAGEVDPDAARAKAAGALNDAADDLDRAADQDEQSLDALRDQFQGLSETENAPSSPLSKALSEGDYGEAQRLIEEYQRQIEQLEESERRAIADELRQLSESIDQPEESAPAPRAAEESLRDLGVPEETLDRLRDETNPAPIRDALREEGVDEPIAETLADRLAEENRQRQADEQAQRDAQELKDALRDAAEQARDPKAQEPARPSSPDAPSPNGAAPNQQPNQRDKSAPGQQPEQQRQPSTTPREGESPTPTGAPQQQPQNQPGEQTSPQPAQQPEQRPQPGAPESPSGQQDQSPQPTPGEGGEQRQPEPAPTPEQTPGSAPEKPQQGEPTPDQQAPPTGVPNQPTTPSGDPQSQPAQPDASQPPTGQAPGPQESPDGAPQPAPSGAESEGQSPLGSDCDGAGTNEPGLERARRKLEELNNRQQGARERRESAEEARRKAREMLDRMTPEQREQFERWARELAREKPSTAPEMRPDPSEFARDPVDMRPREPAPDRVIAQWFNPDAKPGDPSDVSRRAIDGELQDAARGAERAVEEQAVHRRYSDIIKRYFENARKSAPAPAPSEQGGE